MDHKQMVLIIKDICADALIGCNSYEQETPQPVCVSLKLTILEPDYADDINYAVNYSSVCDFIKDLITANTYHLIENLAKQITLQLFDKFPLIKHIEVEINKPNFNNKKAKFISCCYQVSRQHKVAIAIGSNLHYPRQQLITAIELLTEFITDLKIAPFFRTSPHGYQEQDDFFNTCISGYTILEPDQLLVNIKKIEKLMGKIEQFANGPRVIDIDILLYDNLVYQHLFLTIPHKRMHNRDFVLIPLAAIEPTWVHPGFQLAIKDLVVNLAGGQQYILEEADKLWV